MPGNPPSQTLHVNREHGPSDPLHPMNDPEVLTHSPTGLQIVRQQYADGHVYEYVIPKGTSITPEMGKGLTPFRQGKMLFSYMEADANYFSVWVPNGEQLAFEVAFEEAATLPEYEHSLPTGEPEPVYQGHCLELTRQRYDGGWMYQISFTLGIPWPPITDLACMAPMVNAPVVGVFRNGTSIVSKVWVVDNTSTVATSKD